ncbi:helix-turn-helix domain-containing protein [Amycolatopsis sp. NPDC049868]|uniref:helix-turn-helix domain-containing protein n=1 Tax=Amycolatopsis sp. NPDC049868 TaxID=3363934 RepID=UPI0037AA5102
MKTSKGEYFSSVKRREIGAELRRIRERAGYLGNDMGRMLEWPNSAVSRLEHGRWKAPDGKIALYLARAKATTAEFDRLLALDRATDDGYQVRPHPQEVPDGLLAVSLLDTESMSCTTYDPCGIPRQLQTEAHIRLVLRRHGHQDGSEFDAAVQDRLRWQPHSSLQRGPFTFYVPEAALLTDLGSPEVTRDQLAHLAVLSSAPRCRIHLIPADAPVAGISTAFTVYQHDEHPPVLHLQHPTFSIFLEQPHDLAYYDTQLTRLAELSLSHWYTTEWLVRTLADLDHRLEPDQTRIPGHRDAAARSGT